MDIQKEREAFQNFCEQNFDVERHEQTYFDEQTQSYENDLGECTESINMAWSAWQTAKAQAVPEWAVIVPKLSANYLFNTVPELGFEHQDQKDTVLYHLNYMASEFRDSAKQFVEDDHAKQKTMIEAQEPAND